MRPLSRVSRKMQRCGQAQTGHRPRPVVSLDSIIEMDDQAWSVVRSWAYHEAGHAVAAHFLGHHVVRCEISVAPGEGAGTCIDHDDNQRDVALFALAGPASQLLFDARHGQDAPEWIELCRGLNDHDVQATMAAIRTWMTDPDPAPRLRELRELEQAAQELIAADEPQRLIQRVAEALSTELVLDEERLRQLLQ